MNKTCKTCLLEKEVSSFRTTVGPSNGKIYYVNKCKSCEKEIADKKKLENPDHFLEIRKRSENKPISIVLKLKTCNACFIEKEIVEFHPRPGSSDGYRNDCMECHGKHGA